MGQSMEIVFGPATLKFRFIHFIKGGDFKHGASACVGARAMQQAIALIARDRVPRLPPADKRRLNDAFFVAASPPLQSRACCGR